MEAKVATGMAIVTAARAAAEAGGNSESKQTSSAAAAVAEIAADTKDSSSMPAEIPQLIISERIVGNMTVDQMVEVLFAAMEKHEDVMQHCKNIADNDLRQIKLFVRGLNPITTSETLKSTFEQFGEVVEASVIMNRNTGNSRCYGFVTYLHADSAVKALINPCKTIDGRKIAARLAYLGRQDDESIAWDLQERRVFVGNVPTDMTASRLNEVFSRYGEIEDGPFGFDKHTRTSRGFGILVYKTNEGAARALQEPFKDVDGVRLYCKRPKPWRPPPRDNVDAWNSYYYDGHAMNKWGYKSWLPASNFKP